MVIYPHVHVRHGAVTGIKNDGIGTAAGEVPGHPPLQRPIHDTTRTHPDWVRRNGDSLTHDRLRIAFR